MICNRLNIYYCISFSEVLKTVSVLSNSADPVKMSRYESSLFVNNSEHLDEPVF